MRSSYLAVNQGQSDIRINRSQFDIWGSSNSVRYSQYITSIATPEYSGETTSLAGRKTASQLRLQT